MNRVCHRCGGTALPGRSRCRDCGGGAWARTPPARQAAYAEPIYLENRRRAIAREPECHWRLPGCTRRSTAADHLVSLSRGGTHDLDNLVGSCRSCNEKRGGAEGRRTRIPEASNAWFLPADRPE